MRTLRLSYALALYALVFLFGVGAAALLPYALSGRTELLWGLSFNYIATEWCLVDSRVRRRPMVHVAQWLMFPLAPFAAPIYLIWSRGWWGVLLAALNFVLIIVLLVAAMVVTMLLLWVTGLRTFS